MIDRSRITGLVLAGGRGVRMGSLDKGLEPFAGRPLAAHALSGLAGHVGALSISANRNHDRYALLDPGAVVFADRFADHAGPLAGLHAGLAACRTDYLVAVPCDAPFFPADLVFRLSTAFDDAGIDVAIAATAERTHPVFCMMRRALQPTLARYIAAGGRRVHDWLATMRVAAVSFPDESAFRNLNTREELRTAEARWSADRMSRTSALALDDARRRIADAVEPVRDIEQVALVDAIDRVLAADLVSPVDVPAHDNAAMDGYALSTGPMDPESFEIVGAAFAGHPYAGPVGPGQCVRIMTGAVMPSDCDAVVPQEQATAVDCRVRFGSVVRVGQHLRLAGEDLRSGQVALPRARRLVPSDLGIAASLGCTTLDVLRRPRIAVFSTGAELREPGEAMPPGAIRDANRYTLMGLLKRIDVDVIDLGIVDDDPAALEATLRRACHDGADAIVMSGGVSVGDADHTRAVMARLGSVDFWSLAIKPGRPMAFGRIATDDRTALLFGLPGNPVAVIVVFYALVRDALLALAGASIDPLPTLVAVCEDDVAKTPGRTEFVRAVAVREDDGWHVRATGAQGSGVLRSMREANCLIVLDHHRGPVRRGDTVEAWPFHGLV